MAKFNPNNSPNAKMLENVQNKGKMQSNARMTVDLDVDLIVENKDNSDVFNMREIERLAKTIESEGFFGVIEVYKKDDGTYEISAGHRRLRAVKMLGWKTIPAIVTDMPESDNTVRRKLIFSNINNRNNTPMDWSRAINYHIETIRREKGLKEGEIAVRGSGAVMDEVIADFGLTRKRAFIYANLAKLIPEIQDMIDMEIIPYYAINPLTSEGEDVQIDFYKNASEILKLAGEDEEGKKKLSVVQVGRLISDAKDRKQAAIEAEKRKEEIEKEKQKAAKLVKELQSKENHDTIPPVTANNKRHIFDKTTPVSQPVDSVVEDVASQIALYSNSSTPYIQKPAGAADVQKVTHTPVLDTLAPTQEVKPTISSMSTPAKKAPTRPAIPTAPYTAPPIDRVVHNLHSQLKSLVEADHSIMNKEEIRNTLDGLKALIAKLESEL